MLGCGINSVDLRRSTVLRSFGPSIIHSFGGFVSTLFNRAPLPPSHIREPSSVEGSSNADDEASIHNPCNEGDGNPAVWLNFKYRKTGRIYVGNSGFRTVLSAIVDAAFRS